MNNEILQDHIKFITYEYNKRLLTHPFQFGELPSLVAYTMELVEKYTGLSGKEKHDIVINLIKDTINKKDSPKKEFAVKQLDNLVENYIDLTKSVKLSSSVSKKKKKSRGLDQTSTDRIINDIYEKIRKLNKNNISDIPHMMTLIMSFIDDYNDIKKTNKKIIALSVFNKIIAEIPGINGDQLSLYQKMGSDLVNTVISIIDGEFDINSAVELVKTGCIIFKKCC
jgi:hypothetical protein